MEGIQQYVLCYVVKGTLGILKNKFIGHMKLVMTYGSETWVVKSVEKSILRRAEKRMLRMMCSVQLADGASKKKLMVKFELHSTIVEVVRLGSLKWLGLVLRKGDDDCIKQAWRFEVKGNRGMGRPA